MPLALPPLGSGPQPGNGCCGGCWMVAATGPASPQQPEAWQQRQRNGEKTNNPRNGCLRRASAGSRPSPRLPPSPSGEAEEAAARLEKTKRRRETPPLPPPQAGRLPEGAAPAAAHRR
ncbi:uncharacterized protein LOC112631317 [Theropithecus gelada]|uniref:uncharacterized protein LOC112631317 n=1 Tax=Theropithecus gelada TaxID=9565 RepID=UPI000DC1ABEE|nr:uncharacterized protein LOC112631317 [Theropithecus gelada]